MAIRAALTAAVATPVPRVRTRNGAVWKKATYPARPTKATATDHRATRVGFGQHARRNARITRDRKHLRLKASGPRKRYDAAIAASTALATQVANPLRRGLRTRGAGQCQRRGGGDGQQDGEHQPAHERQEMARFQVGRLSQS